MCVLSGAFHFSKYMWLGVLTSFHQFMRLKQIGRPGPIYPFFPAGCRFRQISSLTERVKFYTSLFKMPIGEIKIYLYRK